MKEDGRPEAEGRSLRLPALSHKSIQVYPFWMNTISSGPSSGIVVLSPHYDDAAFSLGATLAAAGSGLVANLFTRGAHRALAPAPMFPPAELVAEVSALRQAEDRDFAERLGLQRVDFGLDEPALLGMGIRDPRGIEPSRDVLRGPLLAALAEWTAAGPVTLFCPAGIGGHANHIATRAVVIEAMPRLGGRARVLFYEDLPYAGRWRQRRAGLADLRRALRGHRLVRRIHAVSDPATKLALIRLYASQHREPPKTLRGFSPRTMWPPLAHESAWEAITAS